MMTITLACSLGMSTSLLVDKIREEAKSMELDVYVDAIPFDKVNLYAEKTDILLLGPQIRFMVKNLTEQYGNIIPVIEAMNMSDYALLNAKKILKESLDHYNEKTGTK